MRDDHSQRIDRCGENKSSVEALIDDEGDILGLAPRTRTWWFDRAREHQEVVPEWVRDHLEGENGGEGA